MGSSHPDDVDQLPVPADPGAPDETPDPADWDDAWLPEWLGDEPGGTPPVEDAGPGPAAGDPEPELDGGQPDTDPVPDAGVPDAGEPHAGEPDPDPTPDAGREPDQKGQPDVEDAPDAPDAPDQRAPEPDLAPAAVPAGDLPTADPEEGPVAATTADAGPAGPTAEPAEASEASEAIDAFLQPAPAPVRVVVGARAPSRRRALSVAAGLLVAGAVAAASLLATRSDTPVPAADAATPTASAPAVSGRVAGNPARDDGAAAARAADTCRSRIPTVGRHHRDTAAGRGRGTPAPRRDPGTGRAGPRPRDDRPGRPRRRPLGA
jgi:hypothetical protein